MFAALARLHGLLFRGCLWLLKLPAKTLWALVLSVLALLGEEFRRWAGLAVSGLLIVAVGKAALNYAPAGTKRPLLLLALLLLGIWALAVRRAAHLTRDNNLVRVRQRQAFKELKGEVGQLGGRLEGLRNGLGRRARGTPFEGAWRSNRERRAKEAERAQAAAEAAEERRREAQRQAEAARRAKEEHERWAEQAQYDHDPFQRQGS